MSFYRGFSANRKFFRRFYGYMVVPRSRLKFGERAFSIAAPRAWNSIPADLRATMNTATFKKNLKTFLFREFYSSFWLNSCVTFALLHCEFLFLV